MHASPIEAIIELDTKMTRKALPALHLWLYLLFLVLAVGQPVLGEVRRPVEEVRTSVGKHSEEPVKAKPREHVTPSANRLSPEDWKVERERLRQDISSKLEIRSEPDGVKFASIPGDRWASARFRKDKNDLSLEATFRGDTPPGSGSLIASEAIKRTGNEPDKRIRLKNIINKQTLDELANGTPASETKLGLFGRQIADDLGRKVKGVHMEDDVSDFGSRTNKKNMVFELE